MKIALFRNLTFDHVSPWEKPPVTDGWVQASAWVEVDFPPMSAEDQRIAVELIALDKRQSAFEADFRRQRKALETERAALLKTGT